METLAYTVYMADCPVCGGVIELGDADPEGAWACPDCGTGFDVIGVR